ncbi:hypothetical protein [Gimibacter soli]|uniref:Uncharacterized protein n=1 Tax=Gimibacter soli TaxID=3024400 RepID=A0AAE9XRI9_9PROT|nr:hypothetical protein [Gimibacter soli]WCL53871.1 hypothetical protein PH603_15135 [Gimibacter soli]
MAQRWTIRALMMMTLLAFVVIRMVDLALLDARQDHNFGPHVTMHVAGIDHPHTAAELASHDSVASMTMHFAFHLLLCAVMGAPDLGVEFADAQPTVFRRLRNESALTEVPSPPVPPPLYPSL